MIWKWTQITVDSISASVAREADVGSWREKYQASVSFTEVKLQMFNTSQSLSCCFEM